MSEFKYEILLDREVTSDGNGQDGLDISRRELFDTSFTLEVDLFMQPAKSW